MSARRFTRTAVMRPSPSAASSISWIIPRPCTVATVFSVRSSVQRTGRFRRFAIARQMASSAYTLSFDPKPPPTAGATTRTWCSARPSITASWILRMWGIWVDE